MDLYNCVYKKKIGINNKDNTQNHKHGDYIRISNENEESKQYYSVVLKKKGESIYVGKYKRTQANDWKIETTPNYDRVCKLRAEANFINKHIDGLQRYVQDHFDKRNESAASTSQNQSRPQTTAWGSEDIPKLFKPLGLTTVEHMSKVKLNMVICVRPDEHVKDTLEFAQGFVQVTPQKPQAGGSIAPQPIPIPTPPPKLQPTPSPPTVYTVQLIKVLRAFHLVIAMRRTPDREIHARDAIADLISFLACIVAASYVGAAPPEAYEAAIADYMGTSALAYAAYHASSGHPASRELFVTLCVLFPMYKIGM